MSRKQETGDAFVLEQYVPFHFNKVLERSGRLVELRLRRHDLTRAEFRVLMWVHRYPEASGTVVARSLMMDKSRVVRAIDSLERRGLLERRTNPDDKRENLLTLTAKGERVYAEASPVLLHIQKRMNSALSEDESRVLWAILIKFDGVMNQLETEAETEELPGT